MGLAQEAYTWAISIYTELTQTLMAVATVTGLLLGQGREEEHRILLEDRIGDLIAGLGFQHPLVGLAANSEPASTR